MEQIRSALTSSRVPPSWIAASYPTMRNLASWLEDLSQVGCKEGVGGCF